MRRSSYLWPHQANTELFFNPLLQQREKEGGGQCKGMTPIQENDYVRRQTDYSHISALVQQECAVLWTIDY